MQYTTEKPVKDGFYAVKRPGLAPAIFQVWTDDTTGVTMVSWTGKARGKTLDEIATRFPGAVWSEDPIDISDDNVADADEQTIVGEDDDDKLYDFPEE